MKTIAEEEQGINILSFGRSSYQWLLLELDFDFPIADAGSPGGCISQMYILAEVMQRLGRELGIEGDLLPSDYFDLIGGSGIGA